MSLTFTDIFCGAGGSSLGLAGAGMELKLAANHWERAIETHAANFRHAEHLCADVNNYDMRRLPRTDVLWASPICTETSPAGGVSGYRRPAASRAGQLDLLQAAGHVSQAGMERTRATFHDVIRAAEVHRYLVVIVENVPDVVDRWELFDWWLDGMVRLGYVHQLVSVSSAHVGGAANPWAPQWRDRLYVVFTRRDLGRLPDVAPRPLSLCERCGADVAGVQTWCPSARRRALRVGRYRRIPGSSYGQYWYTCPNPGCRGRVEPYVLAAAAAIDWSDLGTPIPDLDAPLAANTIRRIEAGLARFAQPIVASVAGNTYERAGYLRAWPAFGAPLNTQQCTVTDALAVPPFMVNSNHDDVRVYPVDGRPLPARTTKIGDGVCVPPLMVPSGGTWAEEPTSATDEPMRTRTANPKGFEAVVTPQPFVAMLRNNMTATSIREPLATITAGGTHHALIVPYYTKGKARSVVEPLDTVSTKDRFALVTGVVRVSDCRYRMVKPRESLRAQRFPDTYIVHGNQGEQTMQAGNAVSANVAQWLGHAITAALDANTTQGTGGGGP